MDFRILGPLEVWDRGALLSVRGVKQRALLVDLLLHANDVVPSERLIDDLWGDETPRSAAAALRVRVSQLRKALAAGADALATRAPGYVIRVEPDRLDALHFERLLREGREQLGAGAAGRAAETLAEALTLWRGPALADFTYEPFAQAEIARLEELRLTALEERIEADIAVGRHDVVVGELEALIAGHPLRERLRGQLMVALYRAGRQAEALDAYQETRLLLVDELGIEPSPALQRLQQAILVQDVALELVERPNEPLVVHDERPRLRPITVVATEGAHAAEVLAQHGGRVSHSSAGGVVGLFGTRAVREDDALRAVRAAVELRVRGSMRSGVATGEVVVGDLDAAVASDEGPIAVAARLRQEAAASEILVDGVTRQLVAGGARLESAADSSWRVLELLQEGAPLAEGREAPLVGREFELDRLGVALAGAMRARAASLFTILGEPGIGKSRLASEFVARLDGEAVSLVGRCHSYGEGLTFHPLRQVIEQAAGQVSADAIRDLLRDDVDAEAIAGRVAVLVGSAESGGSAEESFWAVRRLLEAIAREGPHVLVLEDLHWAEPTFLDLVEYLAEWTEAPVLLLCLARPELLERRPVWGGGKANATSVTLGPLHRDETEALVESLPRGAAIGAEARARVAAAAAGNPLFAEQLTASFAEGSVQGGGISVPPTIRALLAARLDRLGPGERAVIERAAVLGAEFWVGGVAELLPQEGRASARRHLEALVLKGFARRRASVWPGDDDFRFAHDLIHDAAYRAMTVELRGELHQRYGEWLARESGERVVEYAEVLGHHFEQAYRSREQAGTIDDGARRVATEAAAHLATAGRRALAREDIPAAANLLGRAEGLLDRDDPARAALLPVLATTSMERGDFAAADAKLREALVAAASSGDRVLRAHALLGRVALGIPTQAKLPDLERQAEAAVAEFEHLGDDQALARALWALANCHDRRGRHAARRAALERALPHARRAGDEELEADILQHLWWATTAGADAVETAQPYLDELGRLAGTTGSPRRQADLLAPLAYLRALKGDIGEARALVDRMSALLEDAGPVVTIRVTRFRGLLELLAGDPSAAERMTRSAHERATALEWREGVMDSAMTLAAALDAQGRHDEAEQVARTAELNIADDDVYAQTTWSRIHAKSLAHHGAFDEALVLVEDARTRAEQTDDLRWQAGTLLDVAEVLRLAGRDAEATAAVECALHLFERKGDDASAATARRLLTATG